MHAEMTEDRRKWLEGRARQMGYGKGYVNFRTCGVCGSAQWAGTTTKDRGDQPIECLEVSEWIEPGPYGCQACTDVMNRAPEVFHWVLGAIAWAHSKPKNPADG